jgi:(p)ppGpp synthase/HD superfamily hydrolase
MFVFTPKGDVIDLPVGATPVDFAYTIHSDIGDMMAGAKVNGKMSQLGEPLKNGDIVEIVTKKSAVPNKKWIEFAKTSSAKHHIRNTLNRLDSQKPK